MDKVQELLLENQSLKEALSNVSAERTAIDQICIGFMKENVQLRTQYILLTEAVKNKDNEILSLKSKYVFELEQEDGA